MKIKIKDLNPNPYRDMKHYPISKEKVDALVSSIKDTGFWDNILARRKDGEIQLAYGHHRLSALKKSLGLETYVDIPVKDLSDALMIQIMANENMDDWKTTPGVIDETVRVAKEFLESHPDEAKKYGDPAKIKHHTSMGVSFISKFLHWPESRVNFSLERLNLIEEKIIDKEAIEKLPTERAARDFVKAIKETKLPLHKQKAAVEKILDSNRGERNVKDAVIGEKYITPKKKAEYIKKDRVMEFETYAAGLRNDGMDFLDKLRKFRTLKSQIGEFTPGINSKSLDRTLSDIQKQISLIIKHDAHEKNKPTSANTKRITN